MSTIPGGKISRFAASVYELTKTIPEGKVATYGQLAALLGRSKGARAVGQALHRNPFAPQVPCHRVVRSNGTVGGFANGTSRKIEILQAEGVKVDNLHIDLTVFGVKLKK